MNLPPKKKRERGENKNAAQMLFVMCKDHQFIIKHTLQQSTTRIRHTKIQE